MTDRISVAYELHPDLDERLADRTQEQIAKGHLNDDDLDPRGYVVTCSTCHRQAWGTPDNLPMKCEHSGPTGEIRPLGRDRA